MKHCSFLCNGWWPFVLFPSALLLPLLYFNWHAIENDVANNVDTLLQSEGVDWAEAVTFNRGRDLLITGIAPDQAAVEQVRNLATSVEGVRAVRFVGNNIAPVPAQFRTIITGDSLVLRGTVADQATIDSLVTNAEAAFGKGKVLNKLSVGENIASLASTNGLFEALSGDGKLGTVTTTLGSDGLTLSGEVLSDSIKAELGDELSALYDGKVNNELVVFKPDVCIALVNELLATGKINFDSGRATITKDSFALLNQISATAEQCPEIGFEVAGHTDASGNLERNMELSQQRAQAVVDYLVDQGLAAEQFNAVGYGPHQAIDYNVTAEGRANNRRIEFRLKQ